LYCAPFRKPRHQWGNTFPVETSGSSVAECVSLKGRGTLLKSSASCRAQTHDLPQPSALPPRPRLCTLAEGLRGYSYLQTFETFESFTLLCRQHQIFHKSLKCHCLITWTLRLARIPYRQRRRLPSPTAACSSWPSPPAVTASQYRVPISATHRRQTIYSCDGTPPQQRELRTVPPKG